MTCRCIDVVLLYQGFHAEVKMRLQLAILGETDIRIYFGRLRHDHSPTSPKAALDPFFIA